MALSATDLAGFPARTLRGDRLLYRMHRSKDGAWWFSSNGGGRFDPVGTGHGTCYFALRPLGAWIEVFRKQMTLAEAEVRERSLWTGTAGADLRLADLLSRRALKYGVTASLGANEQYDASHAFAAAAVRAGFDGVRHLLRHDPAGRLVGVALFAPAGAPDPQRASWPAGRDDAIEGKLIGEARRTFGYRVLPPP